MDSVTIGPLRVRAFGGADRRGGGDGPAIVLCHGYGAPGDDLCALARVVDAGKDVRWFFPEAPTAIDVGVGMMGRAWWPIDMLELEQRLMRGDLGAIVNETPKGLSEARDALAACIDGLERDWGVRRERLAIGGFSQGAMLTTELALSYERPLSPLVVLSGTVICAERWQERARRAGGALDVFMSHGRADPLLPFVGAEALRAIFEAGGAHVDWVPHRGGHEIPHAAIERLGAFVQARLR